MLLFCIHNSRLQCFTSLKKTGATDQYFITDGQSRLCGLNHSEGVGVIPDCILHLNLPGHDVKHVYLYIKACMMCRVCI